MVNAVKTTGLPIADGIESAADLPHTITQALNYREKINSFYELPEDKRPPRDLWTKPHKLSEFFDMVFDVKKERKSTEYIDFNPEDVD